MVALLRGGAWIEITLGDLADPLPTVALLRGGAWIEMQTLWLQGTRR